MPSLVFVQQREPELSLITPFNHCIMEQSWEEFVSSTMTLLKLLLKLLFSLLKLLFLLLKLLLLLVLLKLLFLFLKLLLLFVLLKLLFLFLKLLLLFVLLKLLFLLLFFLPLSLLSVLYDSVPSASYSSVCNVLRQWNIPLIPTYRVYRLYDITMYIIIYTYTK